MVGLIGFIFCCVIVYKYGSIAWFIGSSFLTLASGFGAVCSYDAKHYVSIACIIISVLSTITSLWFLAIPMFKFVSILIEKI